MWKSILKVSRSRPHIERARERLPRRSHAHLSISGFQHAASFVVVASSTISPPRMHSPQRPVRRPFVRVASRHVRATTMSTATSAVRPPTWPRRRQRRRSRRPRPPGEAAGGLGTGLARLQADGAPPPAPQPLRHSHANFSRHRRGAGAGWPRPSPPPPLLAQEARLVAAADRQRR